MSLTNNIQFKQCNSGNYQKGRTQTIQYCVIHYTANRNDSAKDNVDYFARTVTKTSAHYFVDETSIWQSVKDSDIAWAVGANSYKHSKCRNANSISIEMCNSYDNVPNKTFENATDLAAKIMVEYNIPIENLLRHYEVTGKQCPRPYVLDVNKWTNFKSVVAKKIEDIKDEQEWNNMTDEKFAEYADRYFANKAKESASSWSFEYLSWVKDNGIMVGDTTGNQMPQSYTKREELSTMLKSFYTKFIAPLEEKLK